MDEIEDADFLRCFPIDDEVRAFVDEIEVGDVGAVRKQCGAGTPFRQIASGECVQAID